MKQNHSKPAVFGYSDNYDQIEWQPEPPQTYQPLRPSQSLLVRLFADLMQLARREP